MNNLVERIFDVVEGLNRETYHGFVFLNEQHSLMEEQSKLLDEEFDSWTIVSVPAHGLSLAEQKEIAQKVGNKVGAIDYSEGIDVTFVFASPVPFLLKEMSVNSKQDGTFGMDYLYDVRVFHNDKRDKKELPNGKVIFTVAKEGWQLV